MRVQSTKTGKFASVVEQTQEHVQLALEDGSNEVVQIATSTFKRWWKKVEEVESATEPQTEEPQATETETTEPEVEQTQPTEEPTEAPKTEKAEPKKRGPKNDNVQLLLNELEERIGEPISDNPYFFYQGVRKFFHSTGTIALREADAKRIGIEYVKKNYNHPFKAKITIPETAEGITALIDTLLSM